MDRRKIESAALFLTTLGLMLIMPPLVLVFQDGQRVGGIPVEVIYLFVVWVLLVLASWWLGRNLPREAPDDPAPEDER